MQLSAALLLGLCLQVTASGISQTVTFKGRDVPLETVFNKVEQQTGLVFVYTAVEIEKSVPVSIDVKQLPVEEFLQQLFKNQPLEFTVSEKTVFVKKKEIADLSPRIFINTDPPITGVIRDAEGNPIAGVNIVIKGTKKGVVSDAYGKFSIDAKEGEVLLISSINYSAREIKVASVNAPLIVALEKSISQLDEMQVIAYGQTSKRLQTGNVSTVKAAEIAKQPVNNPLLALQGRVPGLMIEQANGFSGGGVKVRIQGQNSINRGNDPFYVIDGVPYVAQLLPNLGSVLGSAQVALSGSPLSFINPAEIESIEVLKDADATAIYGARAANGAILITTKKGKVGTMHVSLNFQSGYGKVSRKLKLLNTSQYLEMRQETKMNDGEPIYDNDYDLNGTWSDTLSHDWQKELIGGKAAFTDAQVGLSGGSSNVQYLVGAGYHRETTVFPTDLADKKVNVHFNLNTFSNNRKFSATFSGSFLNDNNRLSGFDLTKNAMELAPNAPDLRNPDGTLNWGKNSQGVSTLGNIHPLAKITSLYKANTDNLLANAGFNYNILRTLIFKTTIGYSSLSTDELATSPASIWAPEFASYVTRTASYGANTVKTWLAEPQLNFDYQFSGMKINVLVGATVQQMSSKRKLINGSGYISDGVLENVGSATSISIPPGSTIDSRYKYNAGFFRINYNLEDKYILNLSGRRDGSSRYGSANRFHNFGAVGAAWLFSNEKFFRSLSKVINFSKLRVTYGTTGSDQIGDYVYLSLYNNNTPPVPYQGGASLIQNKLTNPYLQWEETKKLSFGLDLGLFGDRVLLTGNYFINNSSNLIYFQQLPATAGPRSLDINLPAVVRNSGIETQLNTINISKKNFKWSSSFNVTIYKNSLERFDNLSNSLYANSFIIGQSINIVRAFPFIGVDSEEGRYLYADQKGNPTDNPYSDPANRTVIINKDPKFFGGLGNSINYKGIQLDLFLQFVKQVGTRYWPAMPGVDMTNQPVSVLDRWQKIGDVKPVQKFTATDFTAMDAYYNMFGSDAYYVDASYIRLKNASLSWTLPPALRNRLSIEDGRIFINAQNLFTITSYKGLDPETQSSVSLPPLRVFVAGFQLTF